LQYLQNPLIHPCVFLSFSQVPFSLITRQAQCFSFSISLLLYIA
jgi:hypothetical protein